MTQEIYYPNPDDFKEKFWKCNFEIVISRYGFTFHVNADHAQAAIDEVIDYIEAQGWEGLLFSREDEQTEEHLDDYISGGNHSRYLNTYNVTINQI